MPTSTFRRFSRVSSVPANGWRQGWEQSEAEAPVLQSVARHEPMDSGVAVLRKLRLASVCAVVSSSALIWKHVESPAGCDGALFGLALTGASQAVGECSQGHTG